MTDTNDFDPLPPDAPERFRLEDLARMLGVGRSTIIRWVQNGRLSRPFRLGPRIRVFKRDQVLADLRRPLKEGGLA
jgi:excisionase family DNA binding protein